MTQTHTHSTHAAHTHTAHTSIAVAASSPFASHTEEDDTNFSSSSPVRSANVRPSATFEDKNVETKISMRARLSSLSAKGNRDRDRDGERDGKVGW
jgi:hypothetical protein